MKKIKIKLSDIVTYSLKTDDWVLHIDLFGTSQYGIVTYQRENGHDITTMIMLDNGIREFRSMAKTNPYFYMYIERLNKWKYHIQKFVS